MDVRTLVKIPLIKIRSERTEKRLFRIYDNKYCIVYSGIKNAYRRKDGWEPLQNKAEVRTFKEWYNETKEMRSEEIIYYIVKV